MLVIQIEDGEGERHDLVIGFHTRVLKVVFLLVMSGIGVVTRSLKPKATVIIIRNRFMND